MTNKIDMSEAIRLRDSANSLGRGLAWHCNNSPMEAWQAAAVAGCKLDGQAKLFHTLYNARPKREPTAQEVAAIAQGLEAMFGYVPLDRLKEIAADPDFALFNLPEEDVI